MVPSTESTVTHRGHLPGNLASLPSPAGMCQLILTPGEQARTPGRRTQNVPFGRDADTGPMIRPARRSAARARREIPMVTAERNTFDSVTATPQGNGHDIEEALEDALQRCRELAEDLGPQFVLVLTDAPPHSASECPYGIDAAAEIQTMVDAGCDIYVASDWLGLRKKYEPSGQRDRMSDRPQTSACTSPSPGAPPLPPRRDARRTAAVLDAGSYPSGAWAAAPYWGTLRAAGVQIGPGPGAAAILVRFVTTRVAWRPWPA
jgi:hypothetical protein